MALAFALGCAAPPERHAQLRQEIVGGQPSASPEDDAVLLLRQLTGDSETICTATLVAHNLVVTARHCVVFQPGSAAYGCTRRGQLIDNGEGGGALGAHVPPQSIEVHVGEHPNTVPAALGRQILSTHSPSSCIDDLAFVVLDRDLEIAPVAVRLDRSTPAGEPITLSGYGLQESSQRDWRLLPRRKQLHETVEGVGPDSDVGIVPELVPRTLVIVGRAGCDGDSGGPAISERTGAIIGIYSNHTGNCASGNPMTYSYVNLPPYRALAREAFAASGGAPLLEAREPEVEPTCDAGGRCEIPGCPCGADPAPPSPSSGCAVALTAHPGTPWFAAFAAFVALGLARRTLPRAIHRPATDLRRRCSGRSHRTRTAASPGCTRELRGRSQPR